MPELPEVQTTVDGINHVATSWTIIDVWTDYRSATASHKKEIKNPVYFKEFRTKVIGHTISRATRRGKNILIHLSSASSSANALSHNVLSHLSSASNPSHSHSPLTILIHMKMTGHVMCGEYIMQTVDGITTWKPKTIDPDHPLNDPFNRFTHFVCTIKKGEKIKHLVMSDMRKFGKVTLIEDMHPHAHTDLSVLGPEPLDEAFRFDQFEHALESTRNTPIKQVLMDQSRIAGVGNIYSDEILWHADVHPLSSFSHIPTPIRQCMFIYTKEVLNKGIDFGGDSMSDYRNINGERGTFQGEHRAYRKTKEPCQKDLCTGVISRMVIGGRSSHFCSVHQQLYIHKK